jgi:sec-independent protein translocase protein TatB
MLPGLGFQEILLLGVIALLVVGPKDLPVMLRELGKWTRKLQAMAAEFRQGFDELARQAELDELRKEVEAMRAAATVPDLETVLTKPEPYLAPDDALSPTGEPVSATTTTVYGPLGEAIEVTNEPVAVEAAPEPPPEPEIFPMSAPKVEAR